MSDGKVHEEGFSKDADKLVRRLSLVALLLSRNGHPVSRCQIRERVEGYPTMSEEAFKRRFYEDRAELAALGIEVVAESCPEAGTEAYSLPADAYYLTPVHLTGEELTALAACLAVLEDRFSYSQPLRLALLSLEQGRPDLLAEASMPAMAVLPETDSRAGAAALPKLQSAIADRKSVQFRYWAITRDEELQRCVDPYGLQLVAGEWYLIGWCHLREAVRTFRLSRIRSRVTHLTRAVHDFPTPSGFDISVYRDRPAWQLGDPRGSARIRVSPSMAWWVQAHWSHCGTAEMQDDGGIVYETAYADARPLLSWILGLAEAAHVLAPVALRRQVREQLERLRERLEEDRPRSEPAPTDADAAEDKPRRRVHADWRVEVDRFTRLTSLATLLLQGCADMGEAVLDTAEICEVLGLGAAELRADVKVLNLVNFGGDGALLYAEFEGRTKLHVHSDLAGASFVRPARLAPLQADTLLLAVELVGGQLPTPAGTALSSAAAKLRAVRRGATPTIASGDLLPPDERVFDAVNSAVKDHRLLTIDYWAEGSGRTTRRTVEPHLLVRSRGEWYYVCWCHTAAGTRVFRVATTKRARVLDELFEPRPDIELDLYRREGIPPSGSYAPMSATVWYSPAVRRWIAERQPVQTLADGSCLAQQPYVDERWLNHYLLRFADQARLLEPAEAVASLRATVQALIADYERP